MLCRDGKLRCFSYMQKDWFYGLKTEHLEGHHPPDVREVPTSDVLLANGGIPSGGVEGKKKGLEAGRRMFTKRPTAATSSGLGEDEEEDNVKLKKMKRRAGTAPEKKKKKSRRVAALGALSGREAQEAMDMMDREAEEVGAKVETTTAEAETTAAKDVPLEEKELAAGEEEAGVVDDDDVQKLANELQQERNTAAEDAAKVGLTPTSMKVAN